MKKFLAVAVLATSVSAIADSAIYDIQYLPKAGTNYGFTDLTYTSDKVEGKSGEGDEEFKGWSIDQTLGHSFSDKFTLNLTLNYAGIEGDPEGGEKYDAAQGFGDIGLNARYRLIDSAYRLDLIGGVRVSPGDLEVDDGDFNNYSGQHALNIGAQFGQKTESMQWAVLARYEHNFEGSLEIKDQDDPDTVNAYSTLHLQADLLNKLAEKSFLRSFVSANFAGLREVEEPKTTFQAPATTYAIGTQYQHLCSENLLLKAGLDYHTVAQDSAYQDSNKGWNFTVGANYQF